MDKFLVCFAVLTALCTGWLASWSFTQWVMGRFWKMNAMFAAIGVFQLAALFYAGWK